MFLHCACFFALVRNAVREIFLLNMQHLFAIRILCMSISRRRSSRSADSQPLDFLRCLKKLPADGRTAALRTLFLVDQGMPVQQALVEPVDARFYATSFAQGHGGPDESTKRTECDARDARMCAELVYGCLRNELRSAHILASVLPRPEGLPRPMRLILEMAVYSLFFLERVPDHAVVHDAVERITSLFGKSLGSVANGALRSVQRLGDAVHDSAFYMPAGSAQHSHLVGLACFYSVPLHIALAWEVAYGPEACVSLMRRSFARPWTGIRVNARHAEAATLSAALHGAEGVQRLGLYGAAFDSGTLPVTICGESLTHWQNMGALSFQSPGSQEIVQALGLPDLFSDAPVWDMCAGYGGKSAALLERGVDVSLASDLSKARLRHLPRECTRLGLPIPYLLLADAGLPLLRRWHGHIVVDAPCSGWGVLARRPDIKRRLPAEQATLIAMQTRILDSAASMLEPGKALLYITCTLHPAENEDAVTCLQARHPHVQLERMWQTPHDHSRLEGMFGAVLRRAQ